MMMIEEGTPPKNGMYVAYVEEMGIRFCQKMLLMWIDGKWCYLSSDQKYRGHAYGWIGPLSKLEIGDET